jgi:hypothetical protein
VEPVSVINILSDDEADDFFDQDAPAKKLKQPTSTRVFVSCSHKRNRVTSCCSIFMAV